MPGLAATSWAILVAKGWSMAIGWKLVSPRGPLP
jgi:hypothetical protein